MRRRRGAAPLAVTGTLSPLDPSRLQWGRLGRRQGLNTRLYLRRLLQVTVLQFPLLSPLLPCLLRAQGAKIRPRPRLLRLRLRVAGSAYALSRRS
jgi:hypothetical protein